jgi:DNA (cytosine-5)-methyltransferase 1
MVRFSHVDDSRGTEHGDSEKPVEWFEVSDDMIMRSVRRSSGDTTRTPFLPNEFALPTGTISPDVAEQQFLRSTVRPDASSNDTPVRIVDLFAGCGGLSLGFAEAARSIGRSLEVALAVDFDAAALAVYEKNFLGSRTATADVALMFPGELGDRITAGERRLSNEIGPIDVLIGGPPCQGHSDLNNRTRRKDEKNLLYLRMVRAAELLRPQSVVIENVPGALNDRTAVVQRSIASLETLGYRVTQGIVDMTRLGVPQRRRRLVVIATRGPAVDFDALSLRHGRPRRNLRWAIEDLASRAPEPGGVFDATARSVADTRRRIDYLFEHDLYELPDSERPPCHASGGHSYSSIYGRLRWEEPTQTITTGFYSMCMGRYVHPSQRRTLTAHEAARVQYFPDFFDFSSAARGQLATMIGNAVPMRLSQAVALEVLR